MKIDAIGLHNQQPNERRKQTADGRSNVIRNGVDPARLYSKIVERYAMLFDNPSARLRFLNNTLARQKERQEQLRQSLRHISFLEKTPFYDWVLEARLYHSIQEELKSALPSLPANNRRAIESLPIPFSARVYGYAHQSRHVLYVLGILLLGISLLGLYSLVSWSARGVNSYLAQKYKTGKAPIFVAPAGQSTPNEAVTTSAKFLPGYQPEKVWMVERASDFERYSNGCRILTKYEMENHPRGYYLIPRGSDTEGNELRRDPIGIVYHTSESDIVPFTSDNNDTIQRRSQGLLDWIRKDRSYNYLIDRYGEIYRIVRDDHAAHHAGHSIWADSKYDYVGLNESFLGICFESTVNAGSLFETLTEAQISAGRVLTNVLRSKYNIDDANCTTHGLVSVNPDKMLIAYHHDWIRNFPFEAMGLSNKYKIPAPNMADYGFTYDDEILDKLGRTLWEGAISAEDEFNRRADKSRANVEVLRRKLRDRYLAQLEKARKLRIDQPGNGQSVIASKAAASNDSAEAGNINH